MAETQTDKPRTLYFDILRMLACYLVILTHSPLPAVEASHGLYYTFFSTLSIPSSELFLCISGAILLPVKKTTSEFYKARFTKLIYPVLFWSIIVDFWGLHRGMYDKNEAIRKLFLIPFEPTCGYYWFIYAICGLYLLAPFISKWLNHSSKKELQLFLLLWSVTLILPLFNYIIPGFYDLNGSYYNMFCYFGGFLGYMILGVYLRKYPIEIGGIKCTLLINLLVTMLLFAVILVCRLEKVATPIIADNLSLFSAFAVANIFTMGQTLSKIKIVQRMAPFFANFAKYSFGIYLCHMIAIHYVRMIFVENRLHPVFETPLISLLSLILAYLVVKLLSKLPYSKFVVGV